MVPALTTILSRLKETMHLVAFVVPPLWRGVRGYADHRRKGGGDAGHRKEGIR
jgi:hypothetical protein